MMNRLLTLLRQLISGPDLPARDRMTLVDVRTTQEYSRQHIEGALNLPLDSLENQAPAQLVERGAIIVVYCQSGMRSRMAQSKLRKMGYTQVINGGGIAKLARRLASGSR